MNTNNISKTILFLTTMFFVSLCLMVDTSRANSNDGATGNRNTFSKVKTASAASNLSDQVIDNIREATTLKANEMMRDEPITVTSATCERSSGGLHDFYSEGDYWWPDTANPQGPYIRKDGQSNPENFSEHRYAMIRFSEITATLTSAWLLTGEQHYAEQAIKHLNAWMVDTATLMNPNMLYAQAIWGRFTGRGIGLIDAYHFVEVAQSAKILIDQNAVSKEQAIKIKKWFQEFLNWMTTHQYGIDEMNAENNHGTCWVATVSSMAKLVGDAKILEFCTERFKTVLLPSQMANDGSFPKELGRTKPYGYSLFNIDAICNVAQILSIKENDLWKFTTEDGRNLQKGMDFIYPYIAYKTSWPFEKDIYIWEEWPVRQSSLLFAGLAYQQEEYIHTFLQLNAYPTHPEVIRNLPLRHPAIWLLDSK